MPFLDIRDSLIYEEESLYQYYRYEGSAHPELKNIDENKQYLEEIYSSNELLVEEPGKTFNTKISFKSPFKRKRVFNDQYRLFGVFSYKYEPLVFQGPDE